VETTRRTAVALLPDPGGVIVAAPGLAAGLVGIPNVPGYPLIARADDPFVPVAEASPLAGSGVGTIRAEASADRAAAVAEVGRAGSGDALAGLAPVNALVTALVDGLGLPLDGALLDLGAAEVRVEETRPSPTELTARATTRLSGISLLGGLVRIASIETTAAAALEGPTATADPPEVEVAGVTVAGIPARITEQGLSLAGSGSPLGALLAPLTDPLLGQGLVVKLAPSESHAEGTTAGARSGGVLIELTSEYQGYPLVLRVTLGDVRAAVQASGQRTTLTPPAPSTGGLGPVGATPTSGLPLPDLAPSIAGPTASPGPVDSGTPAAAVIELLDLRDVYPFLAVLAVLLAGSRLAATSLLRRRSANRAEVKELFRW
jgi:hypothetical protein